MVADPSSICQWNPDMYGIDVNKPGGQEYYDSLFAMYAQWGIDFVKVDDLSRPYHESEISAIRKAIDKTGRPIISALPRAPRRSTMPAHLHPCQHVANLRRFLGQVEPPERAISRCANWAPFLRSRSFSGRRHAAPRRHPRSQHSHTHFTRDEQYTLMTLWSICRSPLIYGGDLPQTDPFTLALITNDESASRQSAQHRRPAGF